MSILHIYHIIADKCPPCFWIMIYHELSSGGLGLKIRLFITEMSHFGPGTKSYSLKKKRKERKKEKKRKRKKNNKK